LRAGLPEDGKPGFIEPEPKVRFLIGQRELTDDSEDRSRFSLAQLGDLAAGGRYEFS